VVDAQEDGHRYLQGRRDATELGRRVLERRQARHQRRPDPRPPVAVPESPDLDVRGGAQLAEGVPGPRGLAARQIDIELPEGEAAHAGGEDDLLPILGGQPLRQRAVVELGREPRARIELLRPGVTREEKRVRVDRRCQVV
jgi:hypothetical protein